MEIVLIDALVIGQKVALAGVALVVCLKAFFSDSSFTKSRFKTKPAADEVRSAH